MSRSRRLGVPAIAALSLALLGCQTTQPQDQPAEAETIFAELKMTLDC